MRSFYKSDIRASQTIRKSKFFNHNYNIQNVSHESVVRECLPFSDTSRQKYCSVFVTRNVKKDRTIFVSTYVIKWKAPMVTSDRLTTKYF